MRLQVPEGVVGGLVVGGITLWGGAVLQQQQRDGQDGVAQLEVPVQYLPHHRSASL